MRRPGARSPITFSERGSVAIRKLGSGKARFGDRTEDVVGQGRLISKGDRVVIVERRPGRVVVEREDA